MSATLPEAEAAFRDRVEQLCAIAFACGCRVAVSQPAPIIGANLINPEESTVSLDWEFVMLSPGEKPPLGRAWTIYECHAGVAVGRSACS